MRTVAIPGTDITSSCIGMGCASLGSRISRSHGLRALEQAHDNGVTWYDAAPAYGAGEAEGILRDFLASRRGRVFVCSKVGLAPPRNNGLLKLVYRAGRPVIGLAAGLRRKFRNLSSTRNIRVPLTPELIETSIKGSLARLGTDYLDIFALHDPHLGDLGRDDVLRALEKIKARGQARYLSVAGSPAAACAGAGGDTFDFFQIADDSASKALEHLKPLVKRPAGFVTHSILGVGGAKDRVAGSLTARPSLMQELATAGYEGSPAQVAASLLMRRAFASNAEGVVLASMFSGNHLVDNVRLAGLPVDLMASQWLERIDAA